MPLTAEEKSRLKRTALEVRRQIVDVTAWSGGAHIGGALSMTDILTILYCKYLNIDPARPDWPDRDRFVLSKGHGGVGHAVMLAHRGYFPVEDLREFNATGSKLGMHLDSSKAVGVDVSTGSMGHGLPQAVGLALAARVLHKSWRTYCVVGDGESNEGSIWEAAMAASHYRLANLTAFCDRNRMMIDGLTEEVMGLEPFAAKWVAFGWQVRSVNGHDFDELAGAIEFALAHTGGPVMIIADTVKGKGVDFMENDPAWHYGGLGGELLAKAKASLERMV
ncbi:MAG TPA: transketolase [Candidatus Hydrogenedentes bacterium]|jgi:transketolase|nr:transketolase [Candidatus Hydrogenedentota bacterium]HPJ97935.1 transketolase [Candidatus Hydrogenedentota bacterium]